MSKVRIYVYMKALQLQENKKYEQKLPVALITSVAIEEFTNLSRR